MQKGVTHEHLGPKGLVTEQAGDRLPSYVIIIYDMRMRFKS